MAEPKPLKADCFLVLTLDNWGRLKVDRIRQSEPALSKGERMVRIALEVDPALWTPMPTPGTTIQVHAPVYPDPVVLASEYPQTALADRPEQTEEPR